MKAVVKYGILLVAVAALATFIYFKVFVPKHTFTTIQPTTGPLQVTVQGIGNVSALNIYAITAQTGGKILQILTDEGEQVKKGDLLVVMDGVDLPQQLAMAQSALVQAEYEVQALQEELNNQRAQERLLKITYSRYKKLLKQQFVAQSEYDKVLADLQGIQAAIAATISRIQSGQTGILVAEKNIEALQEKTARLRVYAPVDGVVILREAEVAQYVQPSTPILQIVDPATLWVETKIDERISGRVKEGQQTIIVLRSQPEKEYRGEVKRIDAMTDLVTRERKINVTFSAIPIPFFINEQARVTIAILRHDNVVKVPLKVVVQKEGRPGMWVVENSRAHFVAIDKLAVSETEMAMTQGTTDVLVIVPDKKKKSLSEGMRIFQ
jgi:RND family efflux transporter MFP subunit